MTIICVKCGGTKSAEDFHMESGRLRRACKACISVTRRARYHADPERWRAKATEAYWENPNLGRQRATEWRKKNPEKVQIANARSYASNPEHHRARACLHAKNNPVQSRFRRSMRRAAEKRALPKWADRDKMRDWYLLAELVTAETGVAHHVDHVVPLQAPTVCGLHWEGNMAVLPASVNQSKSNRHWPDAPVVQPGAC